MNKFEIEQKMMEYSIDEIRMAEKYMYLIEKCEDTAVITKLQEIAKDEIRHYEFLTQTLNNKLSSTPEGKDLKGVLLESVYSGWINRVKSEVENFKIK